MKLMTKFTLVAMLTLTGAGSAVCAEQGGQDQRALDVLNRMLSYLGGLDHISVTADVASDARLDEGLLVANTREVKLKISRPGSLLMERFDGVDTSTVHIHKGQLTVFSTENNFYAKAEVPGEVNQAMIYALDELDLEIPLAEFFFSDLAKELMLEQDEIIYITDKARIRGEDCHLVAVRGANVDLQLWVLEGDKPEPRQISMTMKWEGGSPRNIAFMEWVEADPFDPEIFEFRAPEGALQIPFVGRD